MIAARWQLIISDLVERGLDADRARLWVIEHLPQGSSTPASAGPCANAWEGANAELAKRQLMRLAASLHAKHPGAAASCARSSRRR